MSALPPKADITAIHRRVRAISPPIEARSQLIPALVEFHIQSRPWDGYLDNVRVCPFIRRSFNAGIASRHNTACR